MRTSIRAWTCAFLVTATAWAQADVVPTAILPFAERDPSLRGYGSKVSDILFAELVTEPDMLLVDRAELQKSLDEQELTLAGMVRPDQAVEVGRLTGAKVLITGSLIEVDRTLYIVAKVIGTETSRVIGEKVTGSVSDDMAPMVRELAGKIKTLLEERSGELVAPRQEPADRIAAVREACGDGERPKLWIHIAERHVGQQTIDPAAETEVTLYARGADFDVVDSKTGERRRADVFLEGEGFSEFAMRRGNMVSVRARVELKAVDRASGEVLAIDRQTAVNVALTEQIAGKQALQEAAAQIAARMLPKLVK